MFSNCKIMINNDKVAKKNTQIWRLSVLSKAKCYYRACIILNIALSAIKFNTFAEC